MTPPNDRLREKAKELWRTLVSCPPSQEVPLIVKFARTIERETWEGAIEAAAECGNGIIVYSAEATNLVTTIRNKILLLAAVRKEKV